MLGSSLELNPNTFGMRRGIRQWTRGAKYAKMLGIRTRDLCVVSGRAAASEARIRDYSFTGVFGHFRPTRSPRGQEILVDVPGPVSWYVPFNSLLNLFAGADGAVGDLLRLKLQGRRCLDM